MKYRIMKWGSGPDPMTLEKSTTLNPTAAGEAGGAKYGRVDVRLLLALVVGLFCLYALSAPHTVALEDDGEFILAGYFLGIAHPPGYPLHTLMAYLFAHLPIGSVAYRVHLLSGLFGALASGVAYLSGRQLGADPGRAFVAALCLGLSKVYWSQSIVAEVYTLHLFLFGLMWLLSLRVYHGLTDRRTHLALAAVSGLALANHWPLTLLAAPALVPLLWRRWKELQTWPVLALGISTAVAPYVWMVVRSQMEPVISFYGPLRSFADVWFFISRRGYSGVDHNAIAGWSDKLQFFWFLASEWVRQFTAGGAALAVIGLIWLWTRSRVSECVSLIWIVFATSVLLLIQLDFEYFGQSKAVFRVYLLPAYFGTAILVGCGLNALAQWLSSYRRTRWAIPVIGTTLAGALIATSAPANWRPEDDWGEAYARAVLHETPPNAVMVLESDWAAYTIGYMHFIERQCPDCVLLEPQGLLFPTRLFEPLHRQPADPEESLRAYLSSADRPVIFTDSVPDGVNVVDRWLVQIAQGDERPPRSPGQLSPSAQAFFRDKVARDHPDDDTVRAVQGDLRRHYAFLIAQSGLAQQVQWGPLCQDFFGCLGLVEGMMGRAAGFNPAEADRLLRRAGQLMTSDVHRWDRARFLEVRGLFLAQAGNKTDAISDFRAAIRLSPSSTLDASRVLANLEKTD